MVLDDSWCSAGESLWDPAQSWRTDNPSLSRCLRHTACVALPTLVLQLFAPLQVVSAYRKVRKRQKRRQENNGVQAKSLPLLFLSRLVFIVLSLVLLALEAATQADRSSADALFYCVMAANLVVHGALAFVGHRWRRPSLPLQFFYLLLNLVCYVPTLKTAVESLATSAGAGTPTWLAQAFQFFCFASLLALEAFSDAPPPSRRAAEVGSQECASFASKLTFSWMNRLFAKGYRAEQDDLHINSFPETSYSMRLPAILHTFDRAQEKRDGDKKKKKKRVNILPILLRAYGPSVAGGVAIKMLSDALLFLVPQLLRRFIRTITEDEEHWKGYFWAAVIFSFSTAQVTVVNAYFAQMLAMGAKMRSAVISAVYRKGLSMSAAARDKYTAGQITNLMSIDSQRFKDTVPSLNVLWAGPVQFTLGTYFLYELVGVAAFAGLSVLLFCIPVNLATGYAAKQLQGKQMKAKDERVLLLNEVLQGVKVIKLYAWEIPFFGRLMGIRSREVACLRKNALVFSSMAMFIFLCPVLVTLVSFTVYVHLDPENNVLTAEKIFACMAIFNIIRIPLFLMPQFIMQAVQLGVSVRRINEFLNCEDVAEDSVAGVCSAAGGGDGKKASVLFEEATLAWQGGGSSSEEPALKSVNLEVAPGSLVAVLGAVGAGKSSLLSAILGEMQLKSGKVCRSAEAKVAYVPQVAWIQNLTLKDNILFGAADPDEGKYESALDCCALRSDLMTMPAGDQTEIGENGINLSGGQKQRVSLARSVYADADLYLLDDPLSAVDAHVGEHLFRRCIGPGGALGGKTRVLVTHNLAFLDQMDKVVLLEKGAVVAEGKYADLMRDNKFREFVASAPSPDKDEQGGEGEEEAKESDKLLEDAREKTKRQESVASASTADEEKNGGVELTERRDKIVVEESSAKGRVDWRHYAYFIRKANVWAFSLIVLLLVTAEAVRVAGSVVLGLWADAAKDEGGTLTLQQHNKFIYAFAGTIAVQGLIDFSRQLAFLRRCASVSSSVHRAALDGVFHSPMRFFDSNPTGRVVNRFSSDIDVLDWRIPGQMGDAMFCVANTLAVLLVIAYNTPLILIFFVPIVVAGCLLQVFFARTKRQIKRLEAVNKSPIFAQFSETVQGASVIRAYSAESRFVAENNRRVDVHLHCTYLNDIAFRWLGIRVEYLGNAIILLTGIFTNYYRESLSTGIAAMVMAYAVMMLDALNWTIRMVSELESDSVALERLREYEFLDREDEWFTRDKNPEGEALPADWPPDGSVTFDKYATRYRPGMPEVVKDLSLEVRSGERLGICGRTGAGKSSVTLAMFRIVEPTAGKLYVAGRDATTVGLQDLRSALTIIPQDPVLFSGTLRFNLDPTGSFGDDAVWSAVKQARLAEAVSEGGLEQKVSEGGANFSVGQRQLLCLARALLRRSRILVLDEATASVDASTDADVQRTVREEFADTTVLTIAHRLGTILDSDRVLVMSEGRAVELDSPDALLTDERSAFYDMCLNAGLVKAKDKTKVA